MVWLYLGVTEAELLELRALLTVVSELGVGVTEMLTRESLPGEKPQVDI